MGNNEVKEFFEKNAESWVLNGYNDDGYNYPTGYHRSRIIKKILKSEEHNLKIVDLGCGSGNVSIMLAELGHNVIGIDESKTMIRLSEKERNKLSNSIKNNVKFNCEPIINNSLSESTYDVCIAMGVIGYFEKDEDLLKEVSRLLKPGGIFIVSCRNRLFNMQSITFRTKNEINSNYANELIDEIEELYNRIPAINVDNMLKNLKSTITSLPEKNYYDDEEMKSPHEKRKKESNYKPFYEPRQHTPKQIKKIARKNGFIAESFYGVHPHLLDPNLNKMLPPKIFNQISSCLEAFEELSISLVWSSVFISVLKKK